MRRVLHLLPALFLAGALSASAQAPASFSRLGFGARGVALGNALAADAAASPYYNPALAPFAQGQTLSASVAVLTFDRTLQYIQFSTPLQHRAGIAGGLVHGGVSGIDGRDNSGFHTGDLSVDEYAGFIAFGLEFGERVTGGIGLQIFRSELYEGLKPATSIGIDLGWTLLVRENVRLGLVFEDLLARYTWDTSGLFSEGGKSTTDYFPTRIRIGATGYWLDGRLMAALELEARFSGVDVRSSRVSLIGDRPVMLTETEKLTSRTDFVRVGAEYVLTPQIGLRGGIDRTDGGWRPGLGFMVDQDVGTLGARAEYAFVREPSGTGTAHYLALRILL